MNPSPKRYPLKDERDQQIDVQAKSHALEYVIAATQILTVLCLLKGNPAWRGSLSLLFFGIAFTLFHKYRQYAERPYRQAGMASLAHRGWAPGLVCRGRINPARPREISWGMVANERIFEYNR